ncbi:MAG: energy transducer TonB [Gemmatimonadota bacterium]
MHGSARGARRPAAHHSETAGGGAAAGYRNRYGTVLSAGILLSVAVHFLLFQYFPGFTAPAMQGGAPQLTSLELPPEVEIPPPPEQIARPATPTVAEVDVSEEITIAPTTFEANPVQTLAPPPTATEADPSARPRFIPYDTPPRLLNGAKIEKLLRGYYPSALRQAGVGGTVNLWLFVDETGAVKRTVVKESSGYVALDEAAGRVAIRMRFSAAKNRDKVTAVWVSQPIHFAVK